MKVCITNVIQPALLESGLEGIWTPRLNTSIGYCEYKCTLCGQVCPTGAITRLEPAEKMKTKIGAAVIDRSRCLPWSKGTECLVCEEHCPVAEKAIKIKEITSLAGKAIGAPQVDTDLCVGCAICEYNCPASPKKAITISPL